MFFDLEILRGYSVLKILNFFSLLPCVFDVNARGGKFFFAAAAAVGDKGGEVVCGSFIETSHSGAFFCFNWYRAIIRTKKKFNDLMVRLTLSIDAFPMKGAVHLHRSCIAD